VPYTIVDYLDYDHNLIRFGCWSGKGEGKNNEKFVRHSGDPFLLRSDYNIYSDVLEGVCFLRICRTILLVSPS